MRRLHLRRGIRHGRRGLLQRRLRQLHPHPARRRHRYRLCAHPPGGYLVGHGQQVSAGQRIAYAGDTGNSFGCHLHFEVYVNGATVNPATFLRGRGVSV
ncbi:M23 family metallopeptidase [Microbacterium sp. NIBRBAC000506063]|uniref:M23 family metallopeptidase n=1 Tax=Microbacterium sp. NIBRBAC000506063 TaxID=2734618 RepID=UPI003980B873